MTSDSPDSTNDPARDDAPRHEGGEGSGARPGFLRSPIALLLLALTVRSLALWVTYDAELVKDEVAYMRRAVALLDGKGYVGSYQSWVKHTDAYKIADLPQYPGAYQPPGYTTFVAGILAMSERNPVAVKAVQVVLGSLTVLLVYFLGRAWFDERTGWLAALLTALYPNLVAFTHLLWSETLFIFLLLGILLILARRLELPGRGACLCAGLALGLAALTRSSILYFAVLLAAWMIWTHRHSWQEAAVRALLVVLAAGAVIAPWTYRNYQIHDGFVLLDTNAPYNLWRGNHPGSFTNRYEEIVPHYEWPFDDIPIHPVARQGASMLVNQTIVFTKNMQPTDLEVTRYASDAAWQYILDEPIIFLGRIRYRMIDMWNPTSFMIRHLQLEAYGDVSPAVKTTVTVIAMLTYLIALPLGIVGLALAWRDPRIWLVGGLIVFFTAISMLAFGLTRFRIPLMPFFLIGAAHLIVRALAARRRHLVGSE